MTDQTDRAWQAYTKTVQAYEKNEDLSGTSVADTPVEKNIDSRPLQEKQAAQRLLVSPLAKPHKPQFLTSIHDIRREMRQGRLSIQAKLDLHGMTLAQAYEQTTDFIMTRSQQQKKLILVITGKGSGGRGLNQEGVLKKNFPYWIDSGVLSDIVNWYSFALKEHGGEGAFYVRLRKPRP
jgi:DNA-nicking Smr family endonuclease